VWSVHHFSNIKKSPAMQFEEQNATEELDVLTGETTEITVAEFDGDASEETSEEETEEGEDELEEVLEESEEAGEEEAEEDSNEE
jgi:hypothetical protein